MKPINFTYHSAKRMRERDITKEEVELTIRKAAWENAEEGKLMCVKSFPYKKERYGRWYRCKDVAPVFVDEEEEIVVITVYAFFSQKDVEDENKL